MNTSQQVKLTLPNQLYELLQQRAGKFGVNLASYVKNLIVNDIRESEYPVRKVKKKVEKSYKKALQERDQAIEVGDIRTHFKSL